MGPRPDTLLDFTELGSFNDESKGSRELANWKGQTLLLNYLNPLGEVERSTFQAWTVWKDATSMGNATTDQQDKVLKYLRSLNVSWVLL